MNDQATTLRNLVFAANIAEGPVKSSAKAGRRRSLAITSGKGGVGKSNLAINLALELGALGNKVGLLDADFGLANADLLCGVVPKFHLGHVVDGAKQLREITVELSKNVDLIPGGSGIERLANISGSSLPVVFAQIRAMEDTLDFLLIDTAAGIADNVSGVLASASEIVVVVTPEPTSIVDAYATIKVALRRSPDKPISIVINNTVGVGDAEDVFRSLNAVVSNFLRRKIEFLGVVPYDDQVTRAIREQIPVVNFAPDSPASRAIRLIAKQLHTPGYQVVGPHVVQSFWDSFSKN